MLASPGAAQAAYTHCDWDPIVPVITPGGNLVLVYDSVWTAYATSLGLPLASYTAKRAYDSSGRPVTAVDMAITTPTGLLLDRKSTRLNSSNQIISYDVFCF